MYGDVTIGLLSVALVCAASLAATAVWLVAVGAHLRAKGAHHANP